MKKTNLNKFRREYEQGGLSKNNVAQNPFVQFGKWMDEAIQLVEIDPTSMVLSTVNKENRPSSRIVLLKEYDHYGLCFFTNYESRKANEIAAVEHASLLFFWKELERQIRIEGRIVQMEASISDTYFKSRPLESRISAIVSPQSRTIQSRDALDEDFKQYQKELNEKEPERPAYWGGYKLEARYFEFWQGRSNRLHDRICYEKKDENWKIKRLAP